MLAALAMPRVLAPLYPPRENRSAAASIIRRRVSATPVCRSEYEFQKMGWAQLRYAEIVGRRISEVGNIDLFS